MLKSEARSSARIEYLSKVAKQEPQYEPPPSTSRTRSTHTSGAPSTLRINACVGTPANVPPSITLARGSCWRENADPARTVALTAVGDAASCPRGGAGSVFLTQKRVVPRAPGGGPDSRSAISMGCALHESGRGRTGQGPSALRCLATCTCSTGRGAMHCRWPRSHAAASYDAAVGSFM